MSFSLDTYLDTWAGDQPIRLAAVRVIRAIAEAGAGIAELIAEQHEATSLSSTVGVNADGDQQKGLDVAAHTIMLDALRGSGASYLGSEEADVAVPLDSDGHIAVVMDPLDGSSNIETNVTVGTIFGLLPSKSDGDSLLQTGDEQIAAGFIAYGPRTDLTLTVGEGTHIFAYSRKANRWHLLRQNCRIAADAKEYAVNASNERFWPNAVARYVDDLKAGSDGARGRDFNMRWVGSLVAEATRILQRGGIMLYPADCRHGYERGRLRLTYECNPIAFLIEQAGGLAINGEQRIREIVPHTLHQREPLIFGSTVEIEVVKQYLAKHA